MSDQPKRQIIDKSSAVSIGVVVLIVAFAFFVGSLNTRIDYVEAEIVDAPSRFEFDTMQTDIAEIKTDVKELLKKN